MTIAEITVRRFLRRGLTDKIRGKHLFSRAAFFQLE
jgi:hypothetical protein